MGLVISKIRGGQMYGLLAPLMNYRDKVVPAQPAMDKVELRTRVILKMISEKVMELESGSKESQVLVALHKDISSFLREE